MKMFINKLRHSDSSILFSDVPKKIIDHFIRGGTGSSGEVDHPGCQAFDFMFF